MAAVTLLNASYEPLAKVSFQHAVKMLFREVAIVEEADTGPDGAERRIGPHPWPRVIRLVRYVATKWLYRPAPWSRHGVLVRDRHRCAYCGRRASTIDHILPESRGGRWAWTNNVAACEPCNGGKGNRTPEEAGLVLRVIPYVPTRAELVALQTRF
ncbi:MAG TPA: HNH endonuclease [Marmoricola sp.]|jgi:5-methylcytosine-specific restriction endonuclease McrA|nr:HNH endonuclease [Marmoricola sp.]